MAHVVVLIARLTLGGMWIIAALTKLSSPVPLSAAVEELGFLHGRSAQALGSVLPYLELILGFLLLSGEEIRAASISSVFLLLIFSIAMTGSLLQGKRVRCNCFGQVGTAYVSWATLLRNVALMALASVPLRLSSDYLALHRLLGSNALRGDEPPLTGLPPLLFTWLAMVLGWALVTAMWGTAKAMARAPEGPADALPETRWVRRLIRMDAVQTSPTSTHGD